MYKCYLQSPMLSYIVYSLKYSLSVTFLVSLENVTYFAIEFHIAKNRREPTLDKKVVE